MRRVVERRVVTVVERRVVERRSVVSVAERSYPYIEEEEEAEEDVFVFMIL